MYLFIIVTGKYWQVNNDEIRLKTICPGEMDLYVNL